MMWKKALIMVISLSILLMATGCGAGEETTPPEEGAIENGEQESAVVEVEKDEPEEVEEKDPGEVPIYPNAIRESVWESTGENLVIYTYSAKAEVSQVEEFYDNELRAADWNIFVEVAKQDEGKLYEAMKNANQATIFISECSSNPEHTEIIIEYRGD